MYKSLNKILVNQANILYKQPGILHKMLCADTIYSQDSDLSTSKATPMLKACQSATQLWENYSLNTRTLSTNFSRVHTFNRTYDDFDILRNYFGLVTNRSLSRLSGRISKRSLRTYQQIRDYSSFFKKIAGLFKAKPVKSKKSQCKQVACSKKSSSKTKVCAAKPAPNINFQKAMECEKKIIKKDREEYHIVSPEKMEVGHKEKPPFESEGGPFLEDRLCKEMPERRCQRIMEEHDMKKDALLDIAECRRREEMICKKGDIIKACVKNKKKSCKKGATSKDTCKEAPKRVCNNPVRELDCIVTDFKSECEKSKSEDGKKYKVGEVTFRCKVKKDYTKKNGKDTKAVKLQCTPAKIKAACQKDRGEKESVCASTLILKCVAEEKKLEEPCEDANAKKDKCRMAKPCKKKQVKADESCQDTDAKKEKCRMTKPCKKVESKSAKPCEDANAKADKCRTTKPCPKKNDACTSKKSDDICQKPDAKSTCSNTVSAVKEKCPKFKFECASSKSSRSVQKMLTCSELKAKSETQASCEDAKAKGDKCRMTKPCSIKKKDDDGKKPPKGDCGGCDSGDSSGHCGGSNTSGNVVKFTPVQEEEQPVPPVPHNSAISVTSISNNEALDRVLLKSPDSPILIIRKDSLTEDELNSLDAYSKVDLQMSNSRVISMYLDTVSQEDVLPDPSKHGRRTFLEPVHDTTKSFQATDSRSIAVSTFILSKLFKTKYSSQHVLGTIPTPPSPQGEYPVFHLHDLHSNKNRFLSSSVPDTLDIGNGIRRYYSSMPPAYPQGDPRQKIEQRDPRGVVKLQEPRSVPVMKDSVVKEKVEEPTRKCRMSLSDAKNSKNSGGNNKKDDSTDDKCKVEKPPCPSPNPCCKMDKAKCDMSPEELKKVLPSCKTGSCAKPQPATSSEVCPKGATKKEDKCFDPKDCKLCNFEQGVKAEKKVHEKDLCPTKFVAEDICPPKKKKQLCCYQKKTRPKPIVDPCCRVQQSLQDIDCPLCKKFQILDLPLKPKPKPTVCKITKCGGMKQCSAKGSSPDPCKKLPKRPNVFASTKCPKPKFKEEPPKKKKKEPVSYARCSKTACYQKKCTKKKPPKGPCPSRIMPPKLADSKEVCPPAPSKKVCKRVDEATQKRIKKMCAKPAKRRDSKLKCNKQKSECDKKKEKKVKERECVHQQKEEMACAEMKHTDWRAVPIRGDNRWCRKEAVEKNKDCKAELSKTVLPCMQEKYTSPRYTQNKNQKASKDPKPCGKKPNKPNVRKMSSHPGLEYSPVYNIGRVFSCDNYKKSTPKITGSQSWNNLVSDKKSS